MSDKKFAVEYATRGTAGCNKCKVKIDKGVLRIAKIVPNPFSDSAGDMKQWFHVNCIFEAFNRARTTTKVIEDPEDLDGWQNVRVEDRKTIVDLINDLVSRRCSPKNNQKSTPKKTQKATLIKTEEDSKEVMSADGTCKQSGTGSSCSPLKRSKDSSMQLSSPADTAVKSLDSIDNTVSAEEHHVDNSFRQFRRLCANIAAESSYKAKSAIVATFLRRGADKECAVFRGDLQLWVRMLLPGVVKRVYNVQSRQLMNIFSRVFQCCRDDMLEHLTQGDAADTVRVFFELSSHCRPAAKSTISLAAVDRLLARLATLGSDEQRQSHLADVARRCTANDLTMYVRLVKADLRINAGAKHILDGVHCDAYAAFQTCRDLDAVLQRLTAASSDSGASGGAALASCRLTVELSLMTPVLPMLAAACGSYDDALAGSSSNAGSSGLLAEIKYDGERLQLHKNADRFAFFSRSLKPVQAHKVRHVDAAVRHAFSTADQLVLDAEILLFDTHNGRPLPFGTLGVHKRAAFRDATVCLFVFDCLLLNGRCLVDEPLWRRRQLLASNISEIAGRVQLSEAHTITTTRQLRELTDRVLADGLEGLVLKPLDGRYEPGKRHWLKMKRDYLAGGSMADSADLLVLGAWYGTGANGGIMSVFLMGCRDDDETDSGCPWRTVTKVSGGLGTDTLRRLQDELDMVKIGGDAALLPGWLRCHRHLVPDFVVRNPRAAPVWQVMGAEFTRTMIHSADGISVRFPRVARFRPDKDWRTCTSLQHLRHMYRVSCRSGGDDSSSAKIPRLTADTAAVVVDAGASDGCDKAGVGAQLSSGRREPQDSGVGGLASILRRVTAIVDPGMADCARITRYIVAYDGLVVGAGDVHKATHVVTAGGRSQNGRHFVDGLKDSLVAAGLHVVTPDWLWQSIKKGRVQLESDYNCV